MDDEQLVMSRLIGFGSDPADNSVSVALANEDMRGFQVNLSLSVIPSLMAALSAEAMKLAEANGADVTDIVSSLHAHAVFMSVSAEGHPMIVFELVNGMKLPLELRSGDLAGLSAEMSLLAQQPTGQGH